MYNLKKIKKTRIQPGIFADLVTTNLPPVVRITLEFTTIYHATICEKEQKKQKKTKRNRLISLIFSSGDP